MDDIVSARFDYAHLDQPRQPVRLRLASTVVALANNAKGVDVLYAQGERLTRVSAGHAVYAGYSAMLPYVCPELGAPQRQALSDQVRAPLVYVNVAVRNWRAWAERGIHYVNNPAGFYSNLKLDYPVQLGDYRCPTRPEQPMVLHLVHVPWADGPFKDLRSAWRAGRTQLYARTFAEFEAHARDELTRIVGPGGFDAERDIAASHRQPLGARLRLRHEQPLRRPRGRGARDAGPYRAARTHPFRRHRRGVDGIRAQGHRRGTPRGR